ncbi:MAG: fibronectin type III domain-containing protein [Candidatus Latescibacterota bacterium]|jgi:hypothetical protein
MKLGYWLLSGLLVGLLYSCGGDGGSGAGPDSEPLPDAPATLRVSKIGDGEIQLNWGAVADEGDVIYVVYRAEDDGEAVAVDSTFRTQFGDRALEYEIEYTYYVTAVDNFGREGQRSNAVSGQPFNNLAPLAPTSLRAIAHNIEIFDQLEIALDWDVNEEADLVGYRVYRSTAPDFAVAADFLRAEVATPRFEDDQIEVSTVYYYQVTAYDRGNKESEGSLGARDVALPAAELVEPVEGELAPAQPVFTWRAIAEALSYQVVITTSPTSGEISAIALTGDTTAVFKGRVLSGNQAAVLESGAIYYWKVIASTKEGGVENSVSAIEDFKVR